STRVAAALKRNARDPPGRKLLLVRLYQAGELVQLGQGRRAALRGHVKDASFPPGLSSTLDVGRSLPRIEADRNVPTARRLLELPELSDALQGRATVRHPLVAVRDD